jgi:hypothetical protein
MKINRTALIVQLTQFSQGGNGVVVGMPGVGKTYVLAELVIDLIEKDHPACMLRLDNLKDGSDKEIASLFGMPSQNWIKNLAKVPVKEGKKGVLIFDSFDSLRDEKLRKRILDQIAKAKRDLPNWTILASVRKYDAENSPSLIDLFPAAYAADDNIHCRKITVPDLTDKELKDIRDANASLDKLYQAGNDQLKKIFKTPFFLSLFNIILKKDPENFSSLSVIRSEIEVLDLYWSKVVHRVQPAGPRDLALRKLTLEMVEKKQLSIDRYAFLETLDTDKILIIERLLSDNVLALQGFNEDRLAYSHNILFDYAVSRLMIKESATEIIQFINDDPSRPYFLRPSFLYFFTRLWVKSPALFWKIYNELQQSGEDSIFLFNKIIPARVVAHEYENFEQLQWIGDGSQNHFKQVRDILQAFRYADIKADPINKAILLNKIAQDIQIDHLPDLTILLSGLIEQAEKRGDDEVLKIAGDTARKIFDYSLSHHGKEGLNLESLIAFHSIDQVAITFSADIAESKKRLLAVLNLMDNEGFNIYYINNLVQQLKHIYLHDPDFVESIYFRVFRAEESSDVSATMAKNILMDMVTNRYDQLSMCKHYLERFYPEFIKVYPERGLAMALVLLKSHLKRKDIHDDNLPGGHTFPLAFVVNGIPCTYQIDQSYYRLNEDYKNHEQEILQGLFAYFDLLISQEKLTELKQLLKQYLSLAQTGYNWKKLLQWGLKHIDVLSDEFFGILIQPVVLYSPNTMQEAADFLRAAVPGYSAEQLKSLEEVILGITEYIPDDHKVHAKEYVVKFLNLIPLDQLQIDESKELLKNSNIKPQFDTDDFKFESGVYTDQMYFKDQGLNVEEPLHKQYLENSGKLRAFLDQYRNCAVDSETYGDFLELAKESYETVLLHPEVDQALTNNLLTYVAEVCTLVLRSDLGTLRRNGVVNNDYKKIEEILMYCLEIQANADIDAANENPGSLSILSSPRSEAAGGLIYLLKLTSNEALPELIVKFSTDKSLTVRNNIFEKLFVLYKDHQEVYWEILFAGLDAHPHDHGLIYTIQNLSSTEMLDKDLAKVIKSLSVMERKLKGKAVRSELSRSFYLIALAAYRYTGNEKVKTIILKNLKNNFENANTLIFQLFDIIKPENLNRDFEDEKDLERSKRLIDFLITIQDECEKVLLTVNTAEKADDKMIKTVFEVLNEVILRSYYSLQINERSQNGHSENIAIEPGHRQRFYLLIKPLLVRHMQIAKKIGYVQAITAHRFIEIMRHALDYEAELALTFVAETNHLAYGSAYPLDSHAITEMVKFTEKLLADHRNLMSKPGALKKIVGILEIYARLGWPQALQLLGKLDDIFR